ncbi:hypothetical protein GCM10017600_77150 [Streptosporangium carneum]|uniref:Uncharacterized protein n=1 Tax=Streptosporangium carneum TaxID=47481 RepID=A0A9W6IAT3_9ACTN|nr:hypothetical protein GCM10017600_77150 [Streptosporangium carneum]
MSRPGITGAVSLRDEPCSVSTAEDVSAGVGAGVAAPSAPARGISAPPNATSAIRNLRPRQDVRLFFCSPYRTHNPRSQPRSRPPPDGENPATCTPDGEILTTRLNREVHGRMRSTMSCRSFVEI